MTSANKRSTFLTPREIAMTPDFNRVLVIGPDEAAVELAGKLFNLNFRVTLARPYQSDPAPTGVESLGYDKFKSLRGFPGRFRALFTSHGDPLETDAGIVVFSGDPVRRPKFSAYGLDSGKSVISLSQAKVHSIIEEFSQPLADSWLHVLIVCGLSGESEPGRFSEALELARDLQNQERTQTHFFTRNVKVASHGLERLYRDTRLKGAMFYKFDGIYPHFEKQGGSWRVLFTDPELGRETELVPDLIVVDEEIQSPIYHGVLPPLVSGSLQGGGGLQPESVRFLGVSLPREAVFAMEWAKGPALTSKAHDDVDTVIREALKLRDRASLSPIVSAEVDQDKCAICLTCVRQCPHSAIGFSRTAQVDRIACQACGICVSACPMAAISFKYRESPHPERGLDNFREEGDLSGKIAAFICKNSAARAMEAAAGGICKDLYPVVIPCAGALDQSHILEAFGKGCEGVLVMGCHSGNCASVYGSDIARSRIESARHMLSMAGIEPGRLSFTTLASNSAPEFAEAVISISKISGLKSQENADII